MSDYIFKRGDIVVVTKGELKGLTFIYESDYPIGLNTLEATQALIKFIYGPAKDKKVLVYKSEIALVSEILNNHSVPKYKIGACVSIYREYEFYVGIICDIMQQGVINIYEVKIINTPNFDSLSDDTVLIAENNVMGILNDESNENIAFDPSIIKYLDENHQKEIADRIYEEKVSTYADRVINNRTSINGFSIVDLILSNACEKYANNFAPKFEEDFLKRVKEEIYRDVPVTEDESTFRSSLTYAISRVADKYIDEHKDEIQDLMKNTIHEEAINVAKNKVSEIISRKFKGIFDDLINQITVLSESEDKNN